MIQNLNRTRSRNRRRRGGKASLSALFTTVLDRSISPDRRRSGNDVEEVEAESLWKPKAVFQSCHTRDVATPTPLTLVTMSENLQRV